MSTFSPILRVTTASLLVEFSRKQKSKPGQGVHPPGSLAVSSTELVEGIWTSGEDIGTFGLWEQTDYRIVIEPRRANENAVLQTRSDSLILNVEPVGSHGALVGVVNFGSSVGKCEMSVATESGEIILVFEVFPTKIDYATDYAELLTDIASHSEQLLFAYLQSTYRDVGAELRPKPDRVDWLTLVRSEADALRRGMRMIESKPLVQLKPSLQYSPLHRIRRMSTATVTAIRQSKGRGSWDSIDGTPVRRELPDTKRVTTLDGPEHQWILGGLRSSIAKAETIRAGLEKPGSQAKDFGASRDVSKEVVLREIAEIASMLRGFIGMNVFREVASGPRASFQPSLALLARAGYSEVYRSLRTINESLDVMGHNHRASVNDISVLYEQWCYLEIISMVRDLHPTANVDLQNVNVAETFLGHRIESGSANVVFETPSAKIRVSYNESFPSLTGQHKPDITIRVDRVGRSPVLIILDAKYRLRMPHSSYKWVAPGDDAINSLHRYRDAVVLRETGADPIRGAIKAVALFPASSEQTENYAEAPMFRSIVTLGVGALPFLPQNREFVREWLVATLSDIGKASREAGPKSPREIDRDSMHADVDSARLI